MSVDDQQGTGDFDRLVRRLASASARPKVPWSEVATSDLWEHGHEAWYRTLAEWDPLRSFDRYAERSAEHTALGLQRTLAFYAVGIDLELILRQGLGNLADTLPAGHPAHRFIPHELVEEAEHTAMFEWFTDLAGPGRPRHTSISAEEVQRIAALGRDNPAVFLLYVVCGELMFDRVQRAALASPSTHPLVSAIDRIHCVEEARHLSFGRALLREYLTTANTKLVRRLTYEAPIVARWTSARVIDLPRSLHEELGATDDERREAQEIVRTSHLHRSCMAELHRFCRGVGLVDDRLDGAWNVADDRAGAPR